MSHLYKYVCYINRGPGPIDVETNHPGDYNRAAEVACRMWAEQGKLVLPSTQGETITVQVRDLAQRVATIEVRSSVDVNFVGYSIGLKEPKQKTKPSLKVGDYVETSWPFGQLLELGGKQPTKWKTTVKSITPRDSVEGGYIVVGAATPPCTHCLVVAHPETSELAITWFTKVKK